MPLTNYLSREDTYTREASRATAGDRFSQHNANRRSEYGTQQRFTDGVPYYLDHVDQHEPPSWWGSPRRTTTSSSRLLLIAGFMLHVLLISIHVVLFVVAEMGLEQRVVFPLGQGTDRLSVILPAATQIIWTSYLAIMLVITQELALRRIFSTSQLLTATHDGLSAWSGVGAALLTLLRQFSLPASFVGIFYVALYLVSSHVLHITAPSLITLVATNTTITGEAQVSNALPSLSPLTSNANVAAASAAAGLLPVLGKSQVLTTPGLVGNILYDVPVQETTAGVVAVALTVVDVQCGSVPDAKQIGRKSNLSWTIGANHTGSSFMFDMGLNATEVGNTFVQPNSLYLGLSLYDNPNHQFSNGSIYWPGSGTSVRPADFSFPVSGPDVVAYPFYGANIVFWSFVNVTDDSNTNASYVPLSPAYEIAFTEKKGLGTLGQGIQVIGCTISTNQQKGNFDASTKQLLDAPKRNTSSLWKPWQPSLYNRSKPNFQLATLEETLAMIMTGPIRDKSAVPEYLASQSGLPLTTYDASFANAFQPALVKLGRFEDALANATAAVLWTAARIGGTNNGALFGIKQSTAQTTQVVPALRLNINLVPLITGLVASCILFVLLWLVSPLKATSGNVVTGAGMLQILWLFADSAAQKRVAKVSEEKVSVNKLRKAGMFRVLASGTRDRDGNVKQRAVIDEDDGYERVVMQER